MTHQSGTRDDAIARDPYTCHLVFEANLSFCQAHTTRIGVSGRKPFFQVSAHIFKESSQTFMKILVMCKFQLRSITGSIRL